MPSATEDDARHRATLKLLAEPHARDDDEDLHPAALDPAEVELEEALLGKRPGRRPLR